MNDTRKDGRLAVSLVARYREPSMLDLREGECQDLSLNGMFIQTPKPSPRGALIRFECDAGASENNFRGTGRVVWQRRKPDSRGPAGMGVRFVRLESGDHDALERIIAQVNQAGGGAPASAQAPANAAAAAKLAATMRGQPPVMDPRSDRPPASGRPDAQPGAKQPESTRPEGAPNPVRPPMPTLLEVPQNPPSGRPMGHPMGNTLPGGGAGAPPVSPAGEGEQKRTLLGAAAPVSAQGSARPEPQAPARDDRPPPRAQGHGATILESSQKADAGARERNATEDRRHEEQRGGRGGKKKGRHDKARRSDAGATPNTARGRDGGGAQGDRERQRTDVPLDVNESFGPEYGGRRRRFPPPDHGGDERPDSLPPRTNSGTVMWLVLGTGLIVSWGLVTLFGTVPVGVPDKIEEAHEKSPGTAGSTGQPATPQVGAANPEGPPPEATRRYALLVETRPAGARILVAGQTVVAPARVELDSITPPPLEVRAELTGFKPATVNIWPSEFTPKAGRLEYRLTLDMQPQPTVAAAPTPKAPVQAPAGAAPTPQAPKVHKPEPAEPVASSPKTEPGRPPAPSPPAPEPAPEPAAASPQPAASAPSHAGGALAQALECLGRGDNRCVIRALENRATTARELELLIETYRAMSSTPKAEREMHHYLESYPNGKRSAEYRRLLERRGAKVQ